jgi:hypothetical protein
MPEFENATLYDHYTAQGMLLMNLHNPSLNFQGYADTSTATPSHVENNGWICSETGTVFGISANKGQIIRDTGSAFVAEDIEISANAHRYIDPKAILANHKLTDYTYDTGVTVPTQNITPHWGRGFNCAYYAGEYSRLYFLLNTEDTNANGGYLYRINYYDYDTNSFGTSQEINFEQPGGGSPSHESITMDITKSGYIVIVHGCGLNRDDPNAFPEEIYRSDNPEDITSFSKVTDVGALGETDIGSSYNSIMGTEKTLVATYPNMNYRNAMISDDEGATWSMYTIYDLVNSDYWSYASFIKDGNNGIFMILTHKDNTDGVNSYPKVSLLYTKDGYTWGNIVYYMTEGKKGFCKKIDNEGYINESELINNCMIINDGWYNESGEAPFHLAMDGAISSNGNVVLLMTHGTHNSLTSESSIDNISISRYDEKNETWIHNYIQTVGGIGNMGALGDTPYGLFHGMIFPSGIYDTTMDFLIALRDGSGILQWYWFRTGDGGKTYRKIKQLTNYTTSEQSWLNYSPTIHNYQGFVVFLSDNGNTDLKLLRFDKRLR